MTKRTLVLDFDGVVCDGLNECLLSVWNTWHDLDVDAFNINTLNAIPLDFSQRFTQYRNFVRHSGHFVLPFFSDAPAYASSSDFDIAFEKIAEHIVDDFLMRFENYRAEVIKHKYQEWIDMHSYYDGMFDVVANPQNDIYIVSGKDTYSIVQILASKGLTVSHEKIYGSQKNKIPALQSIADKLGATFDTIDFFDDNLNNTLTAKKAGFNANWAGWGYKTDGDLLISKQENIRLLQLNEFVSQYTN